MSALGSQMNSALLIPPVLVIGPLLGLPASPLITHRFAMSQPFCFFTPRGREHFILSVLNVLQGPAPRTPLLLHPVPNHL